MLSALDKKQDEKLNILIVDDSNADQMALRKALKSIDFTVDISEVKDADSALDQIASDQYSCIFLDYNLPSKNGLELTKEIRDQGIQVPILVLMRQGDEQAAVELMKAGASDYFPKSKLSADAIARLIRSAISMYKAQKIVDATNADLHKKNRLIGNQNKELAQQRRYIYQQNLKLQEVSKLKSEFIATISHELRTPLNAIIGFSQILIGKGKGTLNKTQIDMMGRILANGRNLLELINDILAISKLETSQPELEPTSFDIAELVTTTVEEIKPLAVQKSLAVHTDIDLPNPIVVNDTARVRQILIHLLSNAIKFTNQGSISIQLTPIQESDSIQLAVTDTGCGISEAEQLHIFDPFHQADQKVNRKHSGTGLGLAITYSLVKMMQGNIVVNSKVNKGSTFVIDFPRKVEPILRQPF